MTIETKGLALSFLSTLMFLPATALSMDKKADVWPEEKVTYDSQEALTDRIIRPSIPLPGFFILYQLYDMKKEKEENFWKQRRQQLWDALMKLHQNDINDFNEQTHSTLLIDIIMLADEKMRPSDVSSLVRRALDSGADPDQYIIGRKSPLHVALDRNNLAIAEILLTRGAHPNSNDMLKRFQNNESAGTLLWTYSRNLAEPAIFPGIPDPLEGYSRALLFS